MNGNTSFWDRVDKRGPDECWPWLGELRLPVATLTWQATKGPVPPGKWPQQTCGNSKCCNPAHLELTDPTKAKHKRVMKRRGHFTAEDVLAIREKYTKGKSISYLCRKYKVTYSCIHAIVNRKTWTQI